MSEEEWKQIPGFENYSVSNYGEVWNDKHDKPVKMWEQHNGSYKVWLSRDAKGYSFQVARLVAESFMPGFDEGRGIVWKNGDKHDNHISNLGLSDRLVKQVSIWDR